MDILISVGKNTDPGRYVSAVEQAGGRPHPRYLPDPSPAFDGLILAGGGDVDPALYGERNIASTNIDPARDRAELALLEYVSRLGRPVLGICRGHQVVNVWAGGGLIQDLGERNGIHRWEDGDKTHMVLSDGGFLQELYGSRFRANSAHHQATGPVARSLRVAARAADGTIEALEHRTLPIFTVQFHPERMQGEQVADGGGIFRYFIALCHCISRSQRI